ncbi:MAG: hypothetical protein Q8R02_18150 [Hyphomonadaceae bacterium]|nr:hypothetical protein [Hyphomonadaceae bacterium]
MKTLHVALMALACACGFEASAQSPPTFETQATSLAADCLAAPNATPEAASAAVVTCEKLIVDVDTLKQANPSLGGHDLNVFLIVKSMGESRVAGSYGRIDGVRSARVCDRTERSWALISQLNKTQSPGYAPMMDQLVASTIPAITKCRQENGTPAGAPSLPAG